MRKELKDIYNYLVDEVPNGEIEELVMYLEDYVHNNTIVTFEEMEEMEKKYVYIVLEEMYGDWASENGACNICGVYADINCAKNKIKELLSCEKSEEHIIDNNITIAQAEYLVDVSTDYISFYIYANECDYDKGYASAVLILGRQEVK